MMGNYEQLKTAVASIIRDNGEEEITGNVLQSVLISIINSVGSGAVFAGIATPSTSPSNPDPNMFYIAVEAGTYPNFNLTVTTGMCIFSNESGTWVGHELGVSSQFESGEYITEVSITDSLEGAETDNLPTVGAVNEAVAALNTAVATERHDRQEADGNQTVALNLEKTLRQQGDEANAASVGYYVCDTASATAAKVVNASGYVLRIGGNMRIEMTNANTAANVTMEINGAGAKALFYNGERASASNSWEAGEVLEVYYDGMQYQCADNTISEDRYEEADSWDYAIADTEGHIVLCIKDGHVITKYFKSSSLAFSIEDIDKENCAYTVMDAQGNMAFVITGDGHIVTKNFNSRNVSAESLTILSKLANLVTKFYGKHIAIVGDSISSYQGYLPTGWSWYYPHGNVTSVDKTYWYQVAETLNMTFINCSYSGSSTIGDSTVTQQDVETSGSVPCGCSDARITSLTRDGNTPDIVLILMGINDYIRGYGIGTWDEHSAIPSEGNIGYFSHAYALMLNKIRTALPDARIFCCTLIQKSSSFPDSVNSLQDYNDTIVKLSQIFGADVINTNACGITRYNIGSYSDDGALHPNTAGHKLIADKVITELINKY